MKEFIVPFFGLKQGKHEFDFDINRAFFENFDNALIEDGDLQVHLELEKTSNMLLLNFTAGGVVYTECDRCGDALALPVNGKERLIVKFGSESYDDITDEILTLGYDEHEIDLTQPIYEVLVGLLPTRRLHESETECNQEVIEKLEQAKQQQEAKTDPRWAALKNKIQDN